MNSSLLKTPQPKISSRLSFIVDWIDRELDDVYRSPSGNGKGGNVLLDLRRSLAEENPARLISQFYRLLPRIEKHHYLLGFRIRTWLSAQFQIRLSDPLGRSPALLLPLSKQAVSSKTLRRHFFEHAEVAISPGDVRIEIISTESAA